MQVYKLKGNNRNKKINLNNKTAYFINCIFENSLKSLAYIYTKKIILTIIENDQKLNKIK